MFTSLHRALGISSTDEFTAEMIDQLVERQVAEAPDLDFKAKLPSKDALTVGDLKKDLCALANIGGGVIVYGVAEDDGNKDHAGRRTDVGKVDEGYEQAYLSVAFGQITPPLYGVSLHRIEDDSHNALVVVVSQSRQVPHMFFTDKKDKRAIAVPVRHGTHSVWLAEPEIARLYRERFAAEHDANEKLNVAYQRVMEQRSHDGFWMAGVARPIYPTLAPKPDIEQIIQIGRDAGSEQIRKTYIDAVTPLSATSRPPRRGFRSWRFLDLMENSEMSMYIEFHDDGAVSVLSRLDGRFGDPQVHDYDLAIVVGDLFAAIRHYSTWTGAKEYDVKFGVEWDLNQQLVITQKRNIAFFREEVVPINRFIPIEATIDVLDHEILLRNACDLTLDCLNQAGITRQTTFN